MKLVVEFTEEELHRQGAATAEAFAHELDKAFQMMLRKAQGYGPAWREQGYMGQTARILSKASRLKNLLWRTLPVDNAEETVDETVRDLINLCVFFLLNRGQENQWGRGPGE